MNLSTATITLEAARRIFVDANFAETALGYRVSYNGYVFEDQSLISLCQQLWEVGTEPDEDQGRQLAFPARH